MSSALMTNTINGFGFIKNICTEHDYDLFIRNYFETSHAKGPQDAAGAQALVSFKKYMPLLFLTSR